MSTPSASQIAALLKEHTAIVASVVSIIVGVLGIIAFFGESGGGGSAQPTVNFGEARFGTQQNPTTLLPAGQTAGPEDEVRVCPPNNLYVWVSHDLSDGTAITGEWLRDELIIAGERVVASRQAPNFWVRLPPPAPGDYAFRATANGSSTTWDIRVAC